MLPAVGPKQINPIYGLFEGIGHCFNVNLTKREELTVSIDVHFENPKICEQNE